MEDIYNLVPLSLELKRHMKHLNQNSRKLNQYSNQDLEMKNHQNGKSSILKFTEVSFKKGLTDKDFSQNSLKRSR